MRLRSLVLVMLCSSFPAALGCSSSVESATGTTSTSDGGGGDTSTDGSGGSADCFVPTDGVELGLSGDGASSDPSEADGAFAPTADGFTVTTATDTVIVSGVHPAIPQGTFVHITYGNTQGFYGPPGGFVRLDNLDVLDGQPNPTEAGKRVWFFAASGGGDPGTYSPFAATTESVCSTGDFESGSNTAERLILTGPGFTAKIEPGQQATFAAASGDDAGTYVAKNVDVQFVGAPGGDAWTVTNFTIARSP